MTDDPVEQGGEADPFGGAVPGSPSSLVDEWLTSPWNAVVDGDRLRSVIRFLRPDGSVVFGPPGRSPERLAALEARVRRAGDARLARVVSWWRPSSRIGFEIDLGDAPAATEFRPGRSLAVLREDWLPRGAIVAVEHRPGRVGTAIEVAGRGTAWLGPSWSSPTLPDASSVARPSLAVAGAGADAFEWSFTAGPVAVTRSAILVRSPGGAILLQTETNPAGDVSEARWSLADGVEATPDPASRAWVLRRGRGRPTARLVALGLPAAAYETERGSLVVEGRDVVLRQGGAGPHRCLALLVDWSGRPPTSWRALTVAERSAAVPPGTAFAARVGHGPRRDGLLVYRSLGPAGLRSVLGHQTTARLLVAAFGPSGEVRPWIRATD